MWLKDCVNDKYCLILEKFDVEATATKSAKMRSLTAPGECPRYERVNDSYLNQW